MTEAQMIATEQAKLDLQLTKDLLRVWRSGRMPWSKAEPLMIHGYIEGTMQNYKLTEKGEAHVRGRL